MNTHADKSQENKSQAATNDFSQKQNSQQSEFADNRPEAIAQKKLQEKISRNPKVKQLKAIQEMANNSPKTHRALQLQAIANPRIGININNNEGLEKEADVMGKKSNNLGQKVAQKQRQAKSQSIIQPLYMQRRMAGKKSEIKSETPVIQAKWIDAGGPLLKWEPSEGGVTWWFNQETREMTYTEASVEELSWEEAQKLTWKPHKEWQMESLAQIDIDAAPHIEFTFGGLVSKGQSRWKGLDDVEGRLHPETQYARDWYFNEYYTTKTKTEEDYRGKSTKIASNYNALPEVHKTKRQRGEFTGELNTEQGDMRLDNTYALGGGGETYYNPRTGKAEKMPASEILFQQWRRAAKEQGQESPRLKVKHETVAGDSLPMLKEIRAKTGVKGGQDVTYTPEDKGFYAMLAIPNVTAAIFLIADHGRELGIRTITHIVLRKNSHIEVHFG